MAKQNQKHREQEPPTEARPVKTEWIEKAIQALGLTATSVRGKEANQRILAWVYQQLPGGEATHREYFEKNFSITKTVVMARLGWVRTPASPTEEGGKEPTVADLLTLKSLSKEVKGGLATISERVREVLSWADRVGGLARLREGLESLKAVME